jgi:chromosome segregation ATPase
MSEQVEGEVLSERVDALAVWIKELDAQLRASSVVGDSKSLKELAKALEAWNKHDPKLEKRLTERVDVLADRFATLTGTVNAAATSLAGKDGEIASLRRELEEGNARIESVVRELRQSGPSSEMAELRRAIAELASERKLRSGDQRVDAVTSEVDVLAQRLDTLSKTVSTTAAGLAGREGELVTLRVQLEESDARAASLVTQLRASLEAVSRQVAELDDRAEDSQSIQLFERRIEDLAGKVEQLAAGLNAVSTGVSSANEGLAANEDALAAISQRFAEASGHVNAMILELQTTVASLPASGAIDAAVVERVNALGREIDGVTDHLAQLEEAMTARWRDDASSATAIEQLLGEVSRRLTGLESERDAAIAELDRSSVAWVEERTWVRGQLEQLTAVVEETRVDETLEPRLHELASRVAAMEQGHQSVGAEVARVAAAWDAERAELKRELEALATTLSSLPVPEPGSTQGDERDTSEQLLTELAQRLESMEREGTAAAAEIARAEAFWAQEIGALEVRLEEIVGTTRDVAPEPDTETARQVAELAQRLEAVERDRRTATDSPAETQELRDVRVLMNGLRMRLTSSEKEIAALSSSGDIAPRLDDIGLRLASLERSSSFGNAPAPAPGDGRFRVELRGLEQKMEQLEAGARENRDAVLMQFERLASRLQWRLQQLELESVDAGYSTKATPEPLGQVVPIRGEG